VTRRGDEGQPGPAEQALHSSLTLVALIALGRAHRRFGLPRATWVWALVFLALHTIAARWLYSFVPYDHWTDALFGVRLTEVFGWQRNHFDGWCTSPTASARCRSCWRRPYRSPLRTVEIVVAHAVHPITAL
jgi:hypothetical protein